jgi:serine/threonine protein kinase
VEELLRENDRLGSFLGKPAFGQPNEEPSSEFDSLEQTTLPESSERFQPGQIIAARFLVVRYIARGGMGEVYEMRDQFLQNDRVALKIIRREIAADTSSLRRFEREVILARKVVHPNLCPIYEIFRCQDPAPPFLFLTMKLLQGPTLEAWLRIARSQPANPEAVEIARQLISGVAALHAAGTEICIRYRYRDGLVLLMPQCLHWLTASEQEPSLRASQRRQRMCVNKDGRSPIKGSVFPFP